jgi:predicted phage terminase large subunit-like protein
MERMQAHLINRSEELSLKQDQLIDLLREQKKEKALSDLFYFGKYVLGYDFEEQPHRSYCNDLQNSERLSKLNLEPRGIFKTTITIAYVIWKIIKDPNIRVMIDCEDLSLSKSILSEIKTHFESNGELRILFGDFVGTKKWTEVQIIVGKRTKNRKDPTINTSSIEVNRTGAHIDLLIEDDLHSKFNSQTPEQIDKVEEHWRLNQSILDPGGEEVINGTRYAVKDLYGRIIEKEKARRKGGRRKFHIRVKDAETSGPNGGLYFPTRLTLDYLEDKKLEQGSYVYACQYKNNPVDPSAIKFKPHWIQFYGRYAPDNLTVTATLDPAISTKDDACYSNINVIGTDADGYIHLLDNYRFRAETNVVIDEIFRMNDKWLPIEFGIEIFAFQKSLKYWIAERSRNSGRFIPVKELKTDTKVSKDLRIKALIPYVENGTIKFPGTGPHSLSGGMLDLYVEMTEYPVGGYDDALDSLASQLQLYTPARIERKIVEPVRSFEALRLQERSRRLQDMKRRTPLAYFVKQETPSMFQEAAR